MLPVSGPCVRGIFRSLAKNTTRVQSRRLQSTAALLQDDNDQTHRVHVGNSDASDDSLTKSDVSKEFDVSEATRIRHTRQNNLKRRWNSANIDHETTINEIYEDCLDLEPLRLPISPIQMLITMIPASVAAFALLDDLLLQRKQLTKKVLENLLRLACWAQNGPRVWQIQNLCRERWYYLSIESFDAIAQFYVNTSSLEQVRDFMRQKLDQGHVFSSETFGALITALLKQTETAEALEVFQEIEKLRKQGNMIRLDPRLYYDSLVCFATNADAEALQWMWSKMERTRLLKDVDQGALTLILNFCARAGLPILATDVFKHMAERSIMPKPYHYTSLICSYCKAGDVKNAFNILEIMKKENIERTSTTASGILEFMAKDIETIDRAFATLQDLKAEGHDIEVSALNVVIEASVVRRDLSRAIATYQEHKVLGVEPDINTLNSLVAACVITMQKSLALKLIKTFREEHLVKANGTTFSSLIAVCCLQDDYEDAFRYLEEMKEDGHQPPAEVYSLIIRRCVSRDDARSKVAYDEMVGWGYEDIKIRNLLFGSDEHYVRLPRITEKATGVFDKMRSMAESHKFFEPR